MAKALNDPRSVNTCYINLADWVWLTQGPAKGLEAKRSAVESAQRRGMTGDAMWAKAESTWMLFDLGEWDEVLKEAEEVVQWGEKHGGTQATARALLYKAAVLAERERSAKPWR